MSAKVASSKDFVKGGYVICDGGSLFSVMRRPHDPKFIQEYISTIGIDYGVKTIDMPSGEGPLLSFHHFFSQPSIHQLLFFSKSQLLGRSR